jgi:HAD superfamily hydrolase (TIGR01509 family)
VITEGLAGLLAEARVLLLDFDGPVCSVFAGLPAARIAKQLRGLLWRHGVALPDHVMEQDDPHEILRYTGSLGRPELTRIVDDALTAAEVEAARVARPTPYAREVIVAARAAGRPVAIVSNNAAEAVRTYLDAHRLGRYVHPVVGRFYADPSRMKPDPAPILTAVEELNANPAECVLIGDSVSDITAAAAAGVRSIGYANKPGKRQRLTEAGADAIVDSMAAIATAILAMQDNTGT